MPYRRDGIFPTPAIDLKINFADHWDVYEPGNSDPATVCRESWCLGIWNRPHAVDWPVQTDFVGVSFKPGGAYAFFGLPLSELHNRVVPLDAIWGSAAGEIRERLQAADTPERRFLLLEKILVGRMLACRAEVGTVRYILVEIAKRNGELPIGELCDGIGISHKHLITLFKQLVGATPKELARLHRFKHAIESIEVRQPVDWTSLAHHHGYFDQSHFNRDFEAYTGLNPTTYLKQRKRVHADRPEHAAYVNVLPVG